MRTGGPSAFAEARQEIQLWPAAAVGYYLTNHYSLLVMGLFVVTLFTGAITYHVHKVLREIIEEEQAATKVRQRVSRGRREHESRAKTILRTVQGFLELISPENIVFRIIVWGSMVVNLCVGLGLFWWLGGQVSGQSSPTITALGLFSLPVLMIATIGASLILSG